MPLQTSPRARTRTSKHTQTHTHTPIERHRRACAQRRCLRIWKERERWKGEWGRQRCGTRVARGGGEAGKDPIRSERSTFASRPCPPKRPRPSHPPNPHTFPTRDAARRSPAQVRNGKTTQTKRRNTSGGRRGGGTQAKPTEGRERQRVRAHSVIGGQSDKRKGRGARRCVGGEGGTAHTLTRARLQGDRSPREQKQHVTKGVPTCGRAATAASRWMVGEEGG